MLPSTGRMTLLLTMGSNSCMVGGKVIHWPRAPPANCPREECVPGPESGAEEDGTKWWPSALPSHHWDDFRFVSERDLTWGLGSEASGSSEV